MPDYYHTVHNGYVAPHTTCCLLSLSLAVAVAVAKRAASFESNSNVGVRWFFGCRGRQQAFVGHVALRKKEGADEGVELAVDKDERRLVGGGADAIPAAVEGIRDGRAHHVV